MHVDLVAVLCPFGPLKILVESSRDQNRDIPALLYSVTMIYFMAQDTSAHHERIKEAVEQPGNAIPLTERVESKVSSPQHKGTHSKSTQNKRDADHESGTSPTASPTRSTPSEEDSEESSGLKLGLGDFVFYSVLIARTALYDWVTTVACIIAVLMVCHMMHPHILYIV